MLGYPYLLSFIPQIIANPQFSQYYFSIEMSAKTNQFYKFAIQTSDGSRMSNVIEYQGLFLGQISNSDIPDNPLQQNRKEMFALIRYSATAQPDTLWRGEITNFDAGYNLEIFPHPESPGDYLVFTHPESNLSGSHCYWLQQYGISTEIPAAQTKLIGLKYIHYHTGRFIGVFHWLTTQRIHLGYPHRITIGEINISSRGKQGQLIRIPKQIGINVIHTTTLHDLNPIYVAKNRICSIIPPGPDYMVFQLNLAVQVRYNILTHELSATTEVIQFRQPDGTLLNGWDAYDMPPNPVYNCLYAAPITGTQDLLVQDTWVDTTLYIYKQSDKRFHMIATPSGWPVSSYVLVHFLTHNIAIITKSNFKTKEYWQSLAELDRENLTFNIIGSSDFKHSQSISVMPSGNILLNDRLYEAIGAASSNPERQPILATQAINKVATGLSNTTEDKHIPYQMCELIGKFVLLQSSHVQVATTLND